MAKRKSKEVTEPKQPTIEETRDATKRLFERFGDDELARAIKDIEEDRLGDIDDVKLLEALRELLTIRIKGAEFARDKEDLEHENSNLQDEVAGLEDEKAQLESEIQDKADQINKLEDELEEARREIGILQEANSALIKEAK